MGKFQLSILAKRVFCTSLKAPWSEQSQRISIRQNAHFYKLSATLGIAAAGLIELESVLSEKVFECD